MKRPPGAVTWPPLCIVNPEHGKLLDYPSGFFCPHSDCVNSERYPWFTAEEVGAYDARTATRTP